MKKLTMRERMLAVVHGREVDRVPFVQYNNMVAPNSDVWSEVGREEIGVLRWVCVHRVEHPNCRRREEPVERDGLKGVKTTIETPRGILTQEHFLDPTYGSASIRDHFIKSPSDYEILLAYLRHSVVEKDLDNFNRACRELGDDGLPLVYVDRTPFQQLWIWWVSIEDLCLHLADCPDLVKPCIDAMIEQQRKIFEIVAETPVDFVDFPDNITAPIIGEKNFRKYCLPLYNELGEMLAEKDIPVFMHMDGDLKPLWQAIGQSAVRGLDSLSPPPDNDTSVADARRLWPEMRLFVNFPSSVHLRCSKEIYGQAGEILQQAGHSGRLVIQISENVPPSVWRRSLPEIARAISDFDGS